MAFRTNKTPVLQTKSASGAVASFNTALAMPLVNGEFTIQAYQEGTGDPAPDNVRNIIGFSALNMTKTGKNIKPNEGDNDTYQGVEVTYSPIDDTYTLNGTALNAVTVSLKVFSKLNWKIDTYYTISVTVVSGDFVIPSGTGNTYAVTIENNQFTRIIRGSTSNTADKLNGYKGSGLSFNSNAYRLVFQVFRAGIVFNNLKIKIQIEEGRAATAYEPYVTPEVKTVALGEDVYGGSYNIDGTKRKTFAEYVITGNEVFTLTGNNQYVMTVPSLSSLGAKVFPRTQLSTMLCEFEKVKTYNEINVSGDVSGIGIGNFIIIGNNDYNNWSDFVGKKFIYELAEPIESNIGATEIETFNGSNNIFCDTGDTSVTFKDLDIAKRGNFREVFRLPS